MIEAMIGRKIGMTQIFTSSGNAQAVTAIEAGPCAVTQVKTAAKEGYNAVQLGFGEAKRLKSPQRGHLKGLGQLKSLRESRITDTEATKVGDKVDVSLFKAGDMVDITGMSKGKGFAGVVKRHHFATTTPGRVFKGMRMAGHMGNKRVTALKLEVVDADPGRNLLLVKGAVPGARNGLLLIRKSARGK